MEQNKYLIPLAIVLAGGFIAGAIYFGGGSGNLTTRNTNTSSSDQIDIIPVAETDHVLGNRNANLMIVEYSDTECPFCKVFHNTMKEVLRSYGDQVAWVYRHFPITQLHSKAVKEAEATECAAELGGNQAFWNYTDRLFEITNSNDSLDPAELPRIATYVGLDETAFNACLSSGKYNEFVKNSVGEAVRAGARGTPYSVILAKDGRKVVINGAEPFENVKAKIDALLR
ncbi:MAG: thioredoxin domain-containing protein [Candidatus Zambryskibacteria bacterium]|nr:thioredoxin domain-containing protein [Candidatus Zambryskibacteria bacterium]